MAFARLVWRLGGITAGIFGAKALGGLGGVALMSQLCGTLLGIVVVFAGGIVVYGKNYFVWQEVKMGIFYAGSMLQQVTEDVGRVGVMESKLLSSR